MKRAILITSVAAFALAATAFAPLKGLTRITALRAARDLSTPGPIPIDSWNLGQQRAYRVELQGAMTIEDDQRQPHAVKLTGGLRLRATAFARGEATLAGRSIVKVRADLAADSLRLEVDGKVQDLTTATNVAMQKPFGFEVSGSGSIEELYLSPTLDPQIQTTVRQIIAPLQFVVPATPQHEWDGMEREASGMFEAHYERSGALQFRKNTLRFFDPPLASKFGARERSGDGRIELRDDGIPELSEWTLEESFVGSVRMHGTRSVRLTLQSVQQTEVVPVEFDPQDAVALDTTPAVKVSKPSYEELARGQNMQALLRSLEDPRQNEGVDQTEAITKLEALLRTQGQPAVDQAAAAIRSADSDDMARTLMAALGAAGTPEAQRALTGLAADSKLASGRRSTVLSQIAGLNAPNAETITNVRTMASDEHADPELRNESLLTLGSVVHHGDEGDTDVGAAVEQSMKFLVDRAHTVTADQDRLLVADALGNTGNEGAQATLQELMTDKTPHVRGGAVFGLRLAPGDDVDQLIADAVVGDEAPKVRADALDAMLYRSLTPENRHALVDAIHHDQDSTVRMHALNVATRHVDQDTEVADAMSWASQNDPDEHVRERARKYLESVKSIPD